MGMDIMTVAVYQILTLVIWTAGIIGLVGAIIFVIGGGFLEDVSVFFDRHIFSIGRPIKGMDDNIVRLDKWISKVPKIIGIIIFIVSLVLLVKSYKSTL